MTKKQPNSNYGSKIYNSWNKNTQCWLNKRLAECSQEKSRDKNDEGKWKHMNSRKR